MFGNSSIEAEFVVGVLVCAGAWQRYCIIQIIKRVERCPNKGIYTNHMTFGFAHDSDQQLFVKKPKSLLRIAPFCESSLQLL